MAIRNRRKEDGSGNTWIKWLLLFWFIGAGYVAFLWYIGFSGRDLGVRAIGVTLIIFGIVGYALIKTLLRRGQPKLSQTGELPRIRDGRSPQVIVIMIVSLAALGLLIPWGYKKFRPFPHEEINKTVEELNQRVMYWRMEPSQIILQPSRQLSGLRMQTGLRSLGCAEQPKAQFVISINNL